MPNAHSEGGHHTDYPLAWTHACPATRVLKMHVLRQLREGRLNQRPIGVDYIALKRCLLLLSGAFRCKYLHTLTCL
jgi:hypothetical protein